MKLQTSIKPRRDGTVTVYGLDGKNYVFHPDEFGELTADVEHEPTVAHLLALDLFLPADEADFDRALIALNPSQDDADNADEESGDGLPIEAHTPPVPTGKAAARAAAKASAHAKP